MKPNCYDCKFRSNIVGDAHSKCEHPNNGVIWNNPIAELLSIMGNAHNTNSMQMETGLHIKGNPHGIRSGWFNWPFNFDPTWLESCDGFTQSG
jgi:hypothetical protein